MSTVQTETETGTGTGTVRQEKRRQGPGKSAVGRRNKIILGVLMALSSIAMVIPFVWMLFTSVKSSAELAMFPATFFPQEWHWENYVAALDAAPFDLYFRNSVIISIGHTAITLLFGAMAGYSLARIKFRGAEIVFLGFVAMLMIPTYTKIVPQFLLVKFMPLFGGNDIFGQGGTGWLDSWWALIIPGGLSTAAIFLFRQFYLSLPKELEEAARIDGLSEFRIFAQIYTPLIKPGIATVGLLTFQETWNNFLWPLLVTSSNELRVIQVGLAVFQQLDNTSWNYLMAGTMMATVPMVLMFVFAQKYFVQGFTNAGIK